MKTSGLRGRGGAGFPTGIKWEKVREAAGSPKYVVCNADEGDPGAFMDRMLLESFPYRVIEGMAIAARAVAAQEGIFYIRAEYPLAVERIREALKRCCERGYLGDSVMGSQFRLHLEVQEGAGAFVCGEETALLASIEGRRGMPRLRPPYPAERGLWDRPTLVNNVETLATVPWILRHSGSEFAAMGTGNSRGTKVFALAGKVRRGGLIEVPMGITLREIVEEIGGGVAGAAVQSRAGRWALGRLRARRAGRYPGRLRSPHARRRDHGIRRPGRARRLRLHGRYRALLPPFHPGSVVRQMHLLPHWDAADARRAGSHRHRGRQAGRPGRRWKSWPMRSVRPASAVWARPRRIRCSRRCGIFATSTRRTSKAAALPASAKN